MKFIYCQSLNFLLKCIIDNIENVEHNWKLQSRDFSKYWATKPCAKQIVSLGGFGKVIVPYFFDGSDVYGYIDEFGEIKQKKIIIKTNRNKFEKIVSFVENEWVINVNYAESYFAPFVKYVSELGVCPFLCNYLATYLTDKNRMVMFIERYDFELRDFVKSSKMNQEYLINIIFQFVYTIFILKSYLGMIHFDTHLRNLMLVKTNSLKYKYILLYDRFRKIGILLPFLEYNLKLIDFGLCSIDLSESVDPVLKRSNFNMTSMQTPIHLKKNIGNNMTIDLQYFLLHLHQLVGKNNDLDNFCSRFYDDYNLIPSKIIERNPKFVLLKSQCIIQTHNVGISESKIQNRQHLIDGLLRYCSTYGSVLNDSEQTVFSPFKIDAIPSFNEIFVVHPQATRHNIPSSESKWFRPSFFQINKNRVGYNWMFPVHNYKPIPVKDLPRTGIALKYKNQPFHFTNAYLSFTGENQSLRFHYSKNKSELLKSFICGKFLLYNKKEIVVPKTNGQLFFMFKNGTFTAVYMINPVEYSQIITWSKKQKYDSLIDATHHASFIYEKEQYNNNFKPVMFIKF